MKPLYIDGIGILSRAAVSRAACVDIWKELVETANRTVCPERGCEKAPEIKSLPRGTVEYTPEIPAGKLRRCSRYIRLASEAAVRAAADAGIPVGEEDFRTGVLVSTGYGAVESNIRFADSVARGNPALCSPTVFAATVPNSCVGQICILGGWRGAGTLLMGGDPMEYASLLLSTKKADRLLCGAVEEYSPQLEHSLAQEKILRPELAEGSVFLSLSQKRSEKTACRVNAFGSASFPAYPYVKRISESEAQETMEAALQGLCGICPDLILTAQNGSFLDQMERKVLEKIYGGIPLAAPKRYFGETLGSACLLQAALAAAGLSAGQTPVRTVLITGIDSAGNYISCILEAV